MVQTLERIHQGIFVTYKEEGLLVDCGEGIQRQFKIADIKPTKISVILISHWHGDHVLGLPGLLQTLNASGYEKKLMIYGPTGTKKYFEYMFLAFSFKINFEHKINEVSETTTVSLKDMDIVATPLDHGVPCLGYSIKEKDTRKIRLPFVRKEGLPDGPLLGMLQENKEIVWKEKRISPSEATYLIKGKKVSIVLDTLPCNNAILLAEGSDILISESVYVEDLYNKAEEYKHMTARQAAMLASKSKSTRLILTHFSQRYKTTDSVLEEAQGIFSNVSVAHDFMKIKI